MKILKSDMDKDYFYFKQFKIRHHNNAMKVGTDSVLLGAYAECDNAGNILDIGTGTGIIAIMLAQRSNAIIDAIEIIDEVRELAQENIENCKWGKRINAITCDLENFFPDKKYDLIVSNPPYYSTDIIAPEKNRATARHCHSLPVEVLVGNVFRLLSADGKFQVIYPYNRAEEFEKKALRAGLHKTSELLVKPNFTKSPVRVIFSFSKNKTCFVSHTISIEKYNRHEYSDEYRKLTEDFYVRTLSKKQ